DPSFNAGIFEPENNYLNEPRLVEAIVVQPDGRLVVAGVFDHAAGVVCDRVVRLNAGGSGGHRFLAYLGGTTNSASVAAMVRQPDGKLIVGGSFSRLQGLMSEGLVRLHSDGTPDATFESPLDEFSEVDALALQPDGKILVGGGGY